MKYSKHLNYVLVCAAILALTSCNGVGTATFDKVATGSASSGINNVDNNLSFSGISSIDLKTDSTLRIIWTAAIGAVAYEIYNTTSGTPVYISTVNGQASSSTALTSLTPGANYKFRMRMKTSSGKNDGNVIDVSVTMDAAPSIPSALTLVDPATSPGFDNTPTIKVSGVKSGDVIKLYTDSSCATAAVATGTASGTTIDLTTSTITAGAYNFYSTATNTTPTSSACSTATIAYTLTSCPSGYVQVPANVALGVSAFCVMQFEARNVAGVASSLTSVAGTTPWVNISQTSSKSACTSLDSAHYDLISNPEWLTIAQNIELNTANWSSGVVGTGMIPRGHSENSASALAISNTNDPYNGTGNSSSDPVGSGWEQKRTHTLSNGNIVWDLGGNVWEWTDWSMVAGLQSGPTSCAAGWLELPSVACGALAAADYLPVNTAYNSSQGLGRVYGGSGGAALRGGNWIDGTNDGVFSLFLYYSPSVTDSSFGFRCVYRP